MKEVFENIEHRSTNSQKYEDWQISIPNLCENMEPKKNYGRFREDLETLQEAGLILFQIGYFKDWNQI